ncbi:MAG: glycosyl transferase [Burkholderiales bacterium PBB6]|nr:MAG: glycosyl transferase [Burkholderiales bacterium PBB6]
MTDKEARPKVLIFRSDYLPVSETFVSDHLRTLKRYEPLVVCQRDMPVNHRTSHPVLQVGQGRIGRRLFENFGWAPALSALIKREKPELVHAHFLTDAAKLLPFMAGNDLPFIVTAHGFDATTYDEHLAKFPDGERLLRRRQKLIERVDKILCVSQFIKDEMVARGYPEKKLVVSHLGIDLSAFPEVKQATSARKGVLAVGRLVEKKGTHLLIAAWAKLPEKLREAHPLLLIGDGPLRASLEQQAKELGVTPTFLGSQARSEVMAQLSQAAIFCLPSIRALTGDAEGMPIAIMEALAAATPVCIFDDQPMAEMLAAAEAGSLPKAGDVSELAKELEFLLGSSASREEYSKAGRTFVNLNFNLKTNVAELERVYDQVRALHAE